MLVAGRSDQAEVPLFRENAASLAEVSIQRGISIILDLSEIEPEEMQEILLTYFERLWQLASSLKSPYEIVIEEAHEYIPQGTRTPLKSLLTRFALRGRKRGIGVILASQRSSKVEKDLLTQANILLLHNVVHPIDLGVYKDLIPLSAKEVEQQVRDLEPGSAFLIRGKQVNRLQIRKRSTFHAGATPTLGEHQPHLRMIDASLLEELRAIATQSVKEGGSDRKTTPHQRRMLNVLHEQGKSMDAYEIASWSGDAENTIRNQPPLALVQRGMASRTRVYHKGYRYSSTLSAFLAREFPGADQQALIERVLSWCR